MIIQKRVVSCPPCWLPDPVKQLATFPTQAFSNHRILRAHSKEALHLRGHHPKPRRQPKKIGISADLIFSFAILRSDWDYASLPPSVVWRYIYIYLHSFIFLKKECEKKTKMILIKIKNAAHILYLCLQYK